MSRRPPLADCLHCECPRPVVTMETWTYEADRIETHARICTACGTCVSVEDEGVDDCGHTRHLSDHHTEDAAERAEQRWAKHSDRVGWLKACRDAAAIAWAGTADLVYLTVARKFETARRKAVEPLRLVADFDRVDITSSHVEHVTRLRVELREAMRGWVVRRNRCGSEPAIAVETTDFSSRALDRAIREAADIDEFFAAGAASGEPRPDRAAGEQKEHPGSGEGLGGLHPAAPGDAGRTKESA